MPYDIALDRDHERGLDRYTITVAEGFDASQAEQLGDWLNAAAQNPTATFRIDVSATGRASRAVAALLQRSSWLRARRRMEIVRRQVAAGVAPVLAIADGLGAALL